MTARYKSTTKLPGGFSRLLQIWEDLCDRNSDGYMAGQGGMLANVKGKDHYDVSSTCTPFTGACIGAAFDPNYPRADNAKNPYVPMWNGGTEEMKFYDFYSMHNNDNLPTEAIADFGLGKAVTFQEMRRGDMIGISWSAGGGHGVFCWNVHLDGAGNVDCFQILGCNEPYGVGIYGCDINGWMTGAPAKAKQPRTGTLKKVSAKIFVDTPAVTQHGAWYGVPEVDVTKITRTATFNPSKIFQAKPKGGGYVIGTMKVARFDFDGDQPPGPYAGGDGSGAAASSTPGSSSSATPPKPPPPTTHATVSSTRVPAATLAADPGAKKKVVPAPAQQDPAKPLMSDQQVLAALSTFYAAKWIKSDPGDSTSVTDPKAKAAVKDFQTLFKLDVDGIPGKITKGKMAPELVACIKQQVTQVMYQAFFGAQKLSADPGPADGTNHAQSAAATKELQSQNGLPATGVPDKATQEMVLKLYQGFLPSSSQQGLNPVLLLAYWLGNSASVGGQVTLRVQSYDVKVGQSFSIALKDLISGNEVDSKQIISISGEQSEISFALPAACAEGQALVAHVTGSIEGGKTLEVTGVAPMMVLKASDCASCKVLQALIDDGTIEKKVFQRHNGITGDKNAILALQKHLAQFGYDLGGSGPDGDYGDLTNKTLAFFFIELGQGFLRRPVLTAAEAKVLLQSCQSGFRSKNARKPAPAPQSASQDIVYSSQIKVGGKSFVDWFNQDFQPSRTKEADGEFNNKIYCPGNFAVIFDRISEMSGTSSTALNQFIALFCIFYNEEGGTFLPLPEEPEIVGSSKAGGLAYCFYGSASKESYNVGGDNTVRAGTALKAKGLISDPTDVAQWNGPTNPGTDTFPYNAPAKVLEEAKNCDFFKYRGHGLSQITYRAYHQRYVDPLLKPAGYPKASVLDMTTRELDQAFTDPSIYLAAVKAEWHDAHHAGPAFQKVATDTSQFASIGHSIGGSASYGKKYALRCTTLREQMLANNLECT